MATSSTAAGIAYELSKIKLPKSTIANNKKRYFSNRQYLSVSKFSS